jgi:hypothetical protein
MPPFIYINILYIPVLARPTARPRQDTPEIIMVLLPLLLSFVPSLNILYKPL